MSFLPIIDVGLKLIEKLIPDPKAREKAQLELFKLQQDGELARLQADTQLAVAQNEVNKAEAMSGDKYTSRARPTLMYICCAAIAYTYILQPFLVFIFTVKGILIALPDLDMGIIQLLALGLAGLRTYDKQVVTKSVKG